MRYTLWGCYVGAAAWVAGFAILAVLIAMFLTVSPWFGIAILVWLVLLIGTIDAKLSGFLE